MNDLAAFYTELGSLDLPMPVRAALTECSTGAFMSLDLPSMAEGQAWARFLGAAPLPVHVGKSTRFVYYYGDSKVTVGGFTIGVSAHEPIPTDERTDETAAGAERSPADGASDAVAPFDGDGAAVTPADAELAPVEDSEWEQVYQALNRLSGPAHRWVRTADVTQAVRDVTGLPSLPVARRLDALLSGGRVDKSTDRGLTGMRGTCWRPRPAKQEG